MQRTGIAIAGGGVIGLTAALELASAGLRVTVFERGQAMRESSWAAAGMLAAHDPENPAALRQLSLFSLGLYPEFLALVEQLSGLRVPMRTRLTLQGTHQLSSETLSLHSATENSLPAHPMEIDLASRLALAPSLVPRDLAQALIGAVRAAGVTLLEETEVRSVEENGGGMVVHTSAGPWLADEFVNACGAWAGTCTDAPIAPRKGQMLLVGNDGPDGRPGNDGLENNSSGDDRSGEDSLGDNSRGALSVVIRTPEVYLVPRGDGRIVVGATVEDAGFDRQVDSTAIAQLYYAAAALWPPIKDASVMDSWCGLRPAAPDLLPVIGLCAPHHWIASGHFRNGILLAPGTARLLRQMIVGAMMLGEPTTIDAAPFSCERFAGAASHVPSM
jgi:glycine oxidase